MPKNLDEYKKTFDRLKGRNATLKDWFDAGYQVGLEESLPTKRSIPLGEEMGDDQYYDCNLCKHYTFRHLEHAAVNINHWCEAWNMHPKVTMRSCVYFEMKEDNSIIGIGD